MKELSDSIFVDGMFFDYRISVHHIKTSLDGLNISIKAGFGHYRLINNYTRETIFELTAVALYPRIPAYSCIDTSNKVLKLLKVKAKLIVYNKKPGVIYE